MLEITRWLQHRQPLCGLHTRSIRMASHHEQGNISFHCQLGDTLLYYSTEGNLQ